MLRVAMISSVFHPSIGGAQTHTLRLSQKLQARGVDVMVITRHYHGLARYEVIEGVPTYRVGRGDRGNAIAALTYISESLQLLYRKRKQYDVLHCHMMISPMTIGLLAKPLVRKPVVINPHGRGSVGDVALLLHHQPAGRARLAAARRWGDAFVSISHDIRQELQAVSVPHERIWDIVNGVDLDHFCPADAAAKRDLRGTLGLPAGPLVVFCGRLAPEKGLDVLLSSWPQVRRSVPGAHLALVGLGDERDRLLQHCNQLGIMDSVFFAGGFSDVAPYFRAADVFVLPSRTEGLPVALLEAMSAQLPVVATAVGGMLQVIDDGVTGRLVPVENPSALADGLIEALTSPVAARWATQARRHIAANYSLDAVTDKYIALYRALLSTPDSHASAIQSDFRT